MQKTSSNAKSQNNNRSRRNTQRRNRENRRRYSPAIQLSASRQRSIVALWCELKQPGKASGPVHFAEFYCDVLMFIKSVQSIEDAEEMWRGATDGLKNTEARKEFPGELSPTEVDELKAQAAVDSWDTERKSRVLTDLFLQRLHRREGGWRHLEGNACKSCFSELSGRLQTGRSQDNG